MADTEPVGKEAGEGVPPNPALSRRYSRWSHGPNEIADDKRASGVTEINAKVTAYVRSPQLCPLGHLSGFESQ